MNYEILREENYKRRDGHRKVRMKKKKKQELCSKGQMGTAQYSKINGKSLIFKY